MTPVLMGKDLVLEGSFVKIKDKQVPGIYKPELMRILENHPNSPNHHVFFFAERGGGGQPPRASLGVGLPITWLLGWDEC